MIQYLSQAAVPDKNILDSIISFIDKGGVFIYFIIMCSIAAMAVMLYQAMLLFRDKVIPEKLVNSMQDYAEKGDEQSAESINTAKNVSPSVLQKLCDIAVSYTHLTLPTKA